MNEATKEAVNRTIATSRALDELMGAMFDNKTEAIMATEPTVKDPDPNADWFDGTFVVLDDAWNDGDPIERRYNVKGACMLNKITEGYIDEIFLYDGTGNDNVATGGLAVFVSVDNEVFTSKAVHEGKFTAAVG